MKSYLGIMFGTGRIVTIEKAKTIIEQSSHHRETKDKMIEIIKNTSHKDMNFAFRKLRYPEKSRFIKYFNNLDISPITYSPKSMENRIQITNRLHRNK